MTRETNVMEHLAEEHRPKDLHPITNEPFTRCVQFRTTQDMQSVHYPPPGSPSRELYNYDDDDDVPVYIRDLTDKEFELEQVYYRAACRKWAKDQGIMRIAGRTSTYGIFVTEAGAYASGEWDGGKWLWAQASEGKLSEQRFWHGDPAGFWPGMED